MPKVEQWIQEEVQRYDSALEIMWGEDPEAIRIIGRPIQKFLVIHKHKVGKDVVMVLKDKSGNFVRPHPKVILYGDKELGIQGLYFRDLTKRKDPKDWIREVETKEDILKWKKYSKNKEVMRDLAKDMFNTSAVNPRAYVKNPFYKEV